MDPLSSPLETHILSYRGFTSLTTVSHLWTWVAILTAAISLWRIKSVAVSVPSRRKIQPIQKPPLSAEKPDEGKKRHLSCCVQTPPSARTVCSEAVSISSASVSNSRSLDFSVQEDCGLEGDTPLTKIARNWSGVVLEGWRGDSESVSEMGRLGCIFCDEGRGKFACYFGGEGDGSDGCDAAVEGFSFCGFGALVDEGNCAVACRLAPLTGKVAEWPWHRQQDLTMLNGNIVKLWNGVAGRNPQVDWASRQAVSVF